MWWYGMVWCVDHDHERTTTISISVRIKIQVDGNTTSWVLLLSAARRYRMFLDCFQHSCCRSYTRVVVLCWFLISRIAIIIIIEVLYSQHKRRSHVCGVYELTSIALFWLFVAFGLIGGRPFFFFFDGCRCTCHVLTLQTISINCGNAQKQTQFLL